nr:LptF/LptG family permease [uncultured Carboxylicivirga sp.]
MKKLNLFLIKSYLGPLALTFLISVFILVLQILWKYIDDLVGKGLESSIIAELMFYATMQVIPMALPLAILLASLMTFGSLGENYELTAIKAAGISLPKAMKPLIVITIIISISAFGFSNNILPYANLQFYSIFKDIQQAKPEMEIKEKEFTNGIADFSIKVDKKDKESNLLRGVMIYDQREQNIESNNVTLADSGRLQVSKDKTQMILTLFDGVRYDERNDILKPEKNSIEHQKLRKDIFKEQINLVDLQGFEFNRSDNQGLASIGAMKNLKQLKSDIDSFQIQKNNQIGRLTKTTINFFPSFDKINNQTNNTHPTNNQHLSLKELSAKQKEIAIETALHRVRSDKNAIDNQVRLININENKIRKHTIEIHRKYTLSFACFIFFFIGAPLGAIIRKGGLGMPVVISVLFFIAYYIIDTMGIKMAREGIWPVYLGLWLSSFIILPIGIFLTYQSTTDSSLLSSDALLAYFKKFIKREKYDLTNRLDS